MIIDARFIKRFAWIPRVVEGKRIWLTDYQVLQELRPTYTKNIFYKGYKRANVWYDTLEQLL